MPKTEGLTAKEASAIEYYCNPDSETFNNWTQSYKRAGYSTAKGWKQNGGKVLAKPRIRQAIADYRARTQQIWEHTRQIAIDALNLNIIRLQAKADAGDVAACQAITTAVRELNAISSLHSQTINDSRGLELNFNPAKPKLVKDKTG